LGIGNHARVKEAAKAIKSTVQHPFLIQGRKVAITVSIGVSIFPQDAKSVEELLAHADHAALLAKRAGKNAYRVYPTRAKKVPTARIKRR
jgi:diguanylate cyclase (GGDEF)-like protein